MKVMRAELKYYITNNEYRVLSNLLEKVLTRDEKHLKNKGFIRSLYFDSLGDKAFHEKIDGVENRNKYRLRLYNFDTKWVKFEIKSKFDQSLLKEVAWVSKKDAYEIQNQNYEVLLKYKDKVLNKIYCEFKKTPFYPVVTVDYSREAFVCDFNNIRVCFDRFLKCSTNHLNIFDEDIFMKPILKKGLVILEIKYNGFIPDWLKPFLQIPRFTRSAISKYCTGRLERVVV